MHVLATGSAHDASILLVNHDLSSASDRIIQLSFTDPNPGEKLLTVYRIDEDQNWSQETLELIPTERRTIVTLEQYRCQVLLPAYSVALLKLEAKA